ncbi:MAG: cupin domain-containing protein [Chitinophagia bacterium]|jgi:quercetin dioxygenase-like cupin family protein|nr:cupin domain-containing protein [Chitinophagia bacterium]
MTNVFTENDIVKWTNVAPGVERAILAYDESVMLVKVKFEKGAIGALHQHPHVQISYVASGQFEVEVAGVKKILHQGETFFAASNVWHGVICLEEGVLMDTFSPMRKDFIEG